MPGACPKCGMALEPDLSDAAALTRVEYTCPMHPEIVRDEPGACPICGMALEPRVVVARRRAEPRAGRHDAAASGSRSLLGAAGVPAARWRHGARQRARRCDRHAPANWIGLVCATPVVFWAGWPFFERAWASIVNRSPNMFTLIALGVGVGVRVTAWSARSRRDSSRTASGSTAPSRPTSTRRSSSRRWCCSARCSSCARAAGPVAAIRTLLGLAPQTARVVRDGAEVDVPIADVRVGDMLPRPARREGAGRRRRRRRAQRGRRIDGHRRADPGREGRGRPRDRRHDQRDRHAAVARRARRPRHAARADRPDGRRGAAQPRADSAAGRSHRRVVRAGRGRWSAVVAFVAWSVAGARAAAGARAGQRGRRADHRLPVRARPRDADGDHGRHRARRDGRRPGQERRSARAARDRSTRSSSTRPAR